MKPLLTLLVTLLCTPILAFAAPAEDFPDISIDALEKLIVVYCGGPSCSAYETAALLIRDAGYTNIKHLSAGISGWIGAGKKPTHF